MSSARTAGVGHGGWSWGGRRATAWGTGEDRRQMGEQEQRVLEPLPLFGLSYRRLRLLLGPSLKSIFSLFISCILSVVLLTFP